MIPPVNTKIWGHKIPGYIPSSDSEEEDSEEEEFVAASQERYDAVVRTLGVRWIETPCVEFNAVAVHAKGPSSLKLVGEKTTTTQYGGKPPVPSFRIQRVHAPIVSKTLLGNGLLPTGTNDWIVQWSGPGMRESGYYNLHEFQRLNHFPGSCELTRKDRLWENFNAMKQAFGSEAFDFIPESYVLPDQVEQFLDCYERTNYTWIVKPNSSSQGKGIFLLQNLEDLPLQDCSVVSRYIDNPLLIQGLKFDLRIYVLVTSYSPLRAYIYREGLTRFACSPYSMDPSHMQDAYRHLTNYSVNKTAHNFVENRELTSDNYGHKWSLSALNKHLECVGINCDLMWARIMDLIVKTLLTVEPPIAAKTMQCTVHNNCFELYGFDVLVDDQLKPWLLEVNLSPSMQADSPLDWKVKSSLLSDAFNILGVASPDRQAMANSRVRTRMLQVKQMSQAAAAAKRNASTATEDVQVAKPNFEPFGRKPIVLDKLQEEHLRMVAQSLREVKHCHNFIRLHPTKETVARYQPLWDSKGPRAKEYSELFRVSQATAARVLASVMFGPPPVGAAVSDRRLLKLRFPLSWSSSTGESTAQSASQKPLEDDQSDPDSDGERKQERTRSHQAQHDSKTHEPSSPTSNFSTRQGSDNSSASEMLSPPSSRDGFLPPPLPRPRFSEPVGGGALRVSMPSVPRTEPPIRPPQLRSKSTSMLPHTLQPLQHRENNGQWSPTRWNARPFTPPRSRTPPTHQPEKIATSAYSVIKALRQSPIGMSSLEAFANNFNGEIEL